MPQLPWWNRETSPAIRAYDGIGTMTNLILGVESLGISMTESSILELKYEKRKTHRLDSVVSFEEAVPVWISVVSLRVPVGKHSEFSCRKANPTKTSLPNA